MFFFFSSRRRHTRLTCDWSSDVCSSDLLDGRIEDLPQVRRAERGIHHPRGEADGVQLVELACAEALSDPAEHLGERSEERRVGKECRSRWWPCHRKIKINSERLYIVVIK